MRAVNTSIRTFPKGAIEDEVIPQVSFVLAAHNEEENIRPLHSRLSSFIDHLDVSAEIIMIEDGSTDRTWDVMNEVQALDSRVILIRHQRRTGEAISWADGFRMVRGEIVVSMDADLQDDPWEAEKLLAKLDEGYDMVASWRFPRHDPMGKRLPSLISNSLQRIVLGVRVHDSGSGLRVFRREVVKSLPLYGGFHRFLPALAGALGFRVAEVKVVHHRRLAGRSKHGLSRLAEGMTDLVTIAFLTRFATRPLQWFVRWAVALFAVGIALTGAALAAGILSADWSLAVPLLVGGFSFALWGVGTLLLGLLGELGVYLIHNLERLIQSRELLDRHDGHVQQ